jgi:hypothetical protein
MNWISQAQSNSAQTFPVPGGVYLCQVSESVSCGACCGLYNAADASLEGLQTRIAYRTERFRRTPRGEDSIYAYQQDLERRESQGRPYLDFYACPFLGYIGENASRVGCMLHPLAEGNNGIDYRGLSFYGGLACRDYFCPSHRNLPAAYKEIVKSVCTDWYLYGLVVTEERLLGNFFGEIERRLGRPLGAADAAAAGAAKSALLEFFLLKLSWPFRGQNWRGPGNYFFNDGLYPHPEIDYARIQAEPSAHDGIFRELSSWFASRTELRAAETMIEALLNRALHGLNISATSHDH